MKFNYTPKMHRKLIELNEQAIEKNMMVDWEAMKLVPLNPGKLPWPTGDRTPQDYETKGE